MLGKLNGHVWCLSHHTMADVRMGSPGTLRNIMGRGLIIPYYKLEKGMRIGTYMLCNRLLVMLKQIHFR